MKKNFTLRVDLESDKGIKEGLPKLLDLLKKYKIQASFYLPMGGESNLLDFIKYQKNITSSEERKIKIWSFLDKVRMILFPRDFVAENKNILKRILDEGHEIGLHGWKHREWTRGLEKIDINKAISKSKTKYEKIFGKEPISWASPSYNTNKKVRELLKKEKIKFISDFCGKKERIYDGLKNVPMTIQGKNKMPIIEYLTSIGKNDKEIIEYLKKKMQKQGILSFYIHDLFEARFKLNILEEIFKFLREKKIETKRIIDY